MVRFLFYSRVRKPLSFPFQLGTESKAALCKAGEQLLPRLVRLIYQKQKVGPTLHIVSQLYKALLSQFNAHHPLGIDCRESFFAGDAAKWKDILRRVYFMIERELSRLQKLKKPECDDNFIHLSVHLIAWYYNDTEDITEADVTVDLDTTARVKRIKLSVFRLEQLIAMLEAATTPYEIWPVLHLIACLVYRYPKLITLDEYRTLLRMFGEYQRNNFTNDEKIMDYLYEGFFSLLLAMNHITFTDAAAQTEVRHQWSMVFLNTNKVIGLNQCVQSLHLLLRYMLSHRLDLCETKQLVLSFTDKIVSFPDEESLQETTLQTLFYLVSKVQCNTETRLKLLEWLMPCMETMSSSAVRVYAATLIALCSNAKPAVLQTATEELDYFFAFLKPSSLEYLYAANNFDQGLFTNKSSPVTSAVSNDTLFDFIDTKQIIFNEVVLKKMDANFKRCAALVTKNMSTDVLDVRSIKSILNTLSSWSCFCKYIEFLPPQCSLKESLTVILPDMLTNVLLKLSRLNLLSGSLHPTFCNLFHSINQTALSLVPCVDIEVIRTYTQAIGVNQLPTGNILEDAMPINTYPKEMTDLSFHELSLTFSDKQIKIFRHIVLLTQFSCNQSGRILNDQKLVIADLLQTANDYLTHGFKNMHLLASTYIIHHVMCMADVDEDIMTYCVETYLDMLQTWPRQSDVVEHITLPLLRQLLYKVQHGHARHRENLLGYLTGFYSYMVKGNFGASVQMKIVECFGLLSEIDPTIEWTVSTTGSIFRILSIKNEMNIDTQPMIIEIFAIIRSPFHCVRIEALKYLPFILRSSTFEILKEIMTLDQMFDLLTISVKEILMLDDNFTQSEYVDEAVNRTASFLHAVACVISTCPMFSRQLLNYLFVMFVEKKVNINLFRKLLFLILKDMNVTLKELLNENIGYILTCWYETFQSFLSFPTHALSFDSATFFKANHMHIITILYINKNTKELQHYAKLVSEDVPSLISMALPKILALREDMVLSCEKIVSPHVILKKLEAIVLELLCNVSDYKHLMICACVPKPCNTDINFVRLNSHLGILRRKLNLDVSPVEYLSNNQPASIQRIHLHLSRQIYEARSFEFQIEAIHRYYIFLKLLEPILKQADHLILDFVIHSAVYTLLHAMSSKVQTIDSCTVVLSCLKTFLGDILPQCSYIVIPLLPSLVGSLIPLTQHNNELKKISLKIVEWLVVDHCDRLRDGILTLDPFPQTKEFTNISRVYNDFQGHLPCTSLRKEIKHFVKASNPRVRITQQCRLQGLDNVNHLLTHNRHELHVINSDTLTDFQMKKMEKMMNQLIISLSELVRSSNDEISSKALVCLGKIGPYSMNVTDLAENKPVHNGDSANLMLTKEIASTLIQYLSSDQIKVVSIASESLLHLLDTPEGEAVLKKLTPSERKLVYPLLPGYEKTEAKISLENLFDERKFKDLIDVTGLWVPNTPTTHEQWIANLTSSLMSCFETSKSYLKYLIELCTVKTDFAETILRYLVYFIIRIPLRSKEPSIIVGKRMSYFFSRLHRSLNSRENTSNLPEIHLNKKSVKCLLDVVHFVRVNQDSPHEHLLRLNYLHIAQAAMYCSVPYSAILFSHFSCEQLSYGLDPYSADQCLSSIDYICNNTPEEGANLQDILRAAYTEIDDLDSVLGCGNSHLIDMSSRIAHYKNANNWHRVLECSDILMSESKHSKQSFLEKQMKTTLGKTGLYFIQSQISPDTQDFDASWRLSKWDYPENMSEEPSFESHHYKALKCLHQGESVQCLNHIHAARKSMIQSLCLTDMECTKQVQSVLSKLRMVQEVEEFTETEHDIVSKWQNYQFLGNVEFELIEPILSQRCVLLNETPESGSLVSYYLDIARKARLETHFQVAERILHAIDKETSTNVEILEVDFEQSLLFWDRNELDSARLTLRASLPKMQHNTECALLYSKALRTYGCWQASTKSENLGSIIRKYFEPALNLLPRNEIEERLKTYGCLAKYADDKQVHVSDILSRECKARNIDMSSGSGIEMKQQKIDELENATHTSEKKTYLNMAMEYYMKSLAEGDLIDIKVFRVVSLWLENTDDVDLLDMVGKSIMSVPSYKFVKVLPQLVARISNVQTKQNSLILQVIEKCAVDHPHHTLPLIMAVANSLKDEIYLKKSAKTPTNNATMDARIRGAEFLLMKLKRQSTNEGLVEIIKQLEVLSLAYIIFANNFLGDARHTASKHAIPNSQQLMKIKDFNKISVPTVNVKLEKVGVYSNVVGVSKFDRMYSIPGGVNEPKRITCIGTDGQKYIQLLKGKDDPRQDAVMQQVFTIMNDLLKANKTASKRNLCVTTYKVVPLSQMSGIIEWCSDSMPICSYLLGESGRVGAHAKYNPQDLSHRKCRESLDKLHKVSAPTSKKLGEYLSICKKFKPVFRYFFLENFASPSEWHSMQTNYTRSVATSSMIGYILGLGDRHLNNILISLKTAQVIHIDFGIAFEQGLILPTPETVPFRLTRDVEDGMGVTGTEGTFKKSCEATLSVLRENTDTIRTILEVLLYDPLYTWTLTPSKAAEKQKLTNARTFSEASSLPVNKIAARALYRIEQKLQGIEEGSVFSVEGQTSILIQRARDPDNLCRLFPGWQPYL